MKLPVRNQDENNSPSTKKIGEWYAEIFRSLDTSIPLDERKETATRTVMGRIDAHKRTVPLPRFFIKK